MVHSTFGLFMNWSGTQKGEGFEYHLLVLAITAFLMIRGAGAFSGDRAIAPASPSQTIPAPGSPVSRQTHVEAPRLWIVLARCYYAISRIAERSVSETGLCLTDFMALEALLHKGSLRIGEIQAKVLLASGSMTAAVDRLEKKGLVVRSPAQNDRRAKLLELTPEGRRVVEAAFRRHAVALEAGMAIWNQTEKRQVYALLKKLGLFAAGAGADAGQGKEVENDTGSQK